MVEATRPRTVALVLIFSFILFFSSYLSAQKTPGKGNLIGKIYAKNGITAIEGATVKIESVTTHKVYESNDAGQQVGMVRHIRCAANH